MRSSLLKQVSLVGLKEDGSVCLAAVVGSREHSLLRLAGSCPRGCIGARCEPRAAAFVPPEPGCELLLSGK